MRGGSSITYTAAVAAAQRPRLLLLLLPAACAPLECKLTGRLLTCRAAAAAVESPLFDESRRAVVRGMGCRFLGIVLRIFLGISVSCVREN